MVPFALLLLSSFMKKFGMFDLPQPWTLRNWVEAMTRGDIPRAFWNSMRLAVSASIIGMMVYSLLAYIVVKTRFYGRRMLDFLTWLPAIIPGLVLSDVVMPKLGGADLARMLAVDAPRTKVIYMSGYPNRALPGGRALDLGAVLQKPFTPRQLLDWIREALQSKAA